MNYRHAFHAGNFADVVKHAILSRILTHLGLKDAAFRVVDTHAGIGWYDLAGDEAGRTGEWRDGIGRLDAPLADEAEALLAPYRAALAGCRARHGADAYPGSPAIVLSHLRSQDRAIFVEKHPADAALLAERMRRRRGAKVLTLDGWTALGAVIPPPERRGLVLIDPPYEEKGELEAAARHLAAAFRRWPTGILALWYPIKDPGACDRMAAALASRLDREALRLELTTGGAGPGLAGTGLFVVNPPWTLAEDAARLLPALAERLARGPGATWLVDRLGAPARPPDA